MFDPHDPISPAQMAWWVAGAAGVVLGLFALLELWDDLRGWLARRRAGAGARSGSFRVKEDQAVRKHHYRRQEPGFHSLHSRGLGDPPVRTADEWSPTDGGDPGGPGAPRELSPPGAWPDRSGNPRPRRCMPCTRSGTGTALSREGAAAPGQESEP